MDKFDLIVIGSGAGMNVVSNAIREDMKVGLIEKGPLGGTCLNDGCIPSKMLTTPADAIRAIQDAKAIGVEASITRIDFPGIMSRMRSVVESGRKHMEKSVQLIENLTLYKETAEFTGSYTLKVGDKTATAPKIVIASGARALVPPVPGLAETGYIDNTTVFNIDKLPESLIIIGAGYIGSEFGHFFSAMGTDVTIIGRSPQVLNSEDPEICRLVKKALSKYMKVKTSHDAIGVEVEGKKGTKIVSAKNLLDGKVYQFEAEEIMVAAGRRPNSDLLKPEKTGIQVDERGWIKVNEHLETTKPGIWAFGDVIGKHMFRHTANYEAEVVWHNLINQEKEPADFHAVPHAVFTYPQVAGVGLQESEALAAGHKVLIGRAFYAEVAKGRAMAMAEDDGFVKVVVEEENGKILGCSIVGTEAAELVQQVVYLMNTEYQDLMPVIKSQVIHPTLNEVLIKAFGNLEHSYQEQGDRIEEEMEEEIGEKKRQR